MQRFFDDFECLDRFTLSLDCLDETVQCPHCSKSHYLVSHGVIYKQRSMDRREAIGKRIFCSNRYRRSGCGRTIQLHVKHAIPALHYGAAQVFMFLSCLLMTWSVKAAYHAATGQSQTRHAWRWLNKLMRNLMDFRGVVDRRLDTFTTDVKHRCRRLQLLLPTVEHVFLNFPDEACSGYQFMCQRAFL
jgi:hypothetical protein